MSKAFDKVWPAIQITNLWSQFRVLYTIKQLSLKKEAESYSKWCHFLIEAYYVWRPTRVNTRSSSIPCIYKRPSGQSCLQSQTICR